MLKSVFINKVVPEHERVEALREICNVLARSDRSIDRIDVTRRFGGNRGSAMDIIKEAKLVAADSGLDVYVHLQGRSLRLTFVHKILG
jgi:hypothetical protein